MKTKKKGEDEDKSILGMRAEREDTKKRSLLATNIAKLAHLNAADVIADEILALAKKQ